jgi:glutaminase
MKAKRLLLTLTLFLVVLPALQPGSAAARTPPALQPQQIQAALDAAYARYKDLSEGANASYIPVLARVDPKLYGIALVTPDGRVYTRGDVTSEVAIESISKVFTLAKVFQQQGDAPVLANIGVVATGMPFNSVLAIERAQGLKQNPFVNAGAITTTSLVTGSSRDGIWQSILGYYGDFAGRALSVNEEVYHSESDNNQHNQAIARLMWAYGRIKSDPGQATDIYTQQCSVSVNARDLAVMAATLANGGVNPVTRKLVLGRPYVPKVLAVMATAGLYETTGEWLYRTGLPAKSGVGGGLIAVSPGRFGIAVISPPLDAAGNSVKAQRTIEAVSAALGGNPYAVP